MSFQQFLVKLTLSLLTSHGDRFLVWLELWVMSEDIHLLTHFITVIYCQINRLYTQILFNQSLFGTKLDLSSNKKPVSSLIHKSLAMVHSLWIDSIPRFFDLQNSELSETLILKQKNSYIWNPGIEPCYFKNRFWRGFSGWTSACRVHTHRT